MALHRETHASHLRPPVDRLNVSSQRHSQVWPPPEKGHEPPVGADEAPKKKKKHGFAKIWKLVKGSSNKVDVHVGSHDFVRSPDRHDDDFPLTPPPPLSYLVERGPGEHFSAGGRHASTPSLLSTSSPWGGFSSPGMSPPTAPSSLLPSPTSSRPSAGNGEAVDKRIGVHTDDNEMALVENAGLKQVHSVTSEPDIRQKLQPTPNNMTLPKAASRQQTILSREKSLPPLPGEAKPRLQTVGGESRPQTLYAYDPRQNSQSPQDLASYAFYRNETRRQSFSGIASRPALGIQTMPLSGDSRNQIGLYNEFGISRRSLGRLGNIDENPPVPPTPKRKSKFSFISLLGKKSGTTSDANGCDSHEFPRLSTPGYDCNEESLYSAYTAYTSSRQSTGPRMSIMSRKVIEELVEQDRDFVAYRYPSQSQPPIDLVR